MKVLDCKETMQDKVLGRLNKEVINELSFNTYPAYLVHRNYLNKVEIINESTKKVLPQYALRFSNDLQIIRNTVYYKTVKKELKNHIQNLREVVDLVQLTGPIGNGKSTLLKDLGDTLGYSFEQLDCLNYFNIPQLKKILEEMIPDKFNTKSLLIELVNFEKYKLLIDQFS